MQIKKLYYSVCLISAVFAIFTSALFADTIVLKSGKTVEGKIIEKTAEYVKIGFMGVELTYFMDEVQNIKEDKEIAPFKESYEGASPDSSFQPSEKKDASQIFKQLSPAVVYIRTSGGEGSGFVIDKNGVVVTNHHVIGNSKDITVSLNNGKEYACKEIINYDILKDICILQLDTADELPYISLGEYNRIDIGQAAFTIGNPLGLKYRISDGIVAQKEEVGFRGKIIQFTCPISPGSSGSPLLNAKGQVIGIVSSSIVDPYAQNLNFAVSSDDIKDLLLQNKHLILSRYLELNRGASIILQGNQLIAKGDMVEAYVLFKEAFKRTCTQSGIHDQDCLYLFATMLSITTNMTAKAGVPYFEQLKRVFLGSRTRADVKELESCQKELVQWATENTQLIEAFGGLRAVYDKVVTENKLFSASKRNQENKVIKFEDDLCLGYFNLATIASYETYGQNSFYAAFNKIKEAFPNSRYLKSLKDSESLAKEAIWK